MAGLTRRSLLSATIAWAASARNASARSSSVRVVAYGDSIAEGIGLYNSGTVNLGIHGAGLIGGDKKGLLDNLDKIHQGDLVLVSIGKNDAAFLLASETGKSSIALSHYLDMLKDRLEMIHSRGANIIYLVPSSVGYGEHPSREVAHMDNAGHKTTRTRTDSEVEQEKRKMVRWNEYINHEFGSALTRLAKDMQISYSITANRGIERAEDGLHYSVNGYRRLFENAMADRVTTPSISVQTAPRPVAP